jgi:hypothetical protein
LKDIRRGKTTFRDRANGLFPREGISWKVPGGSEVIAVQKSGLSYLFVTLAVILVLVFTAPVFASQTSSTKLLNTYGMTYVRWPHHGYYRPYYGPYYGRFNPYYAPGPRGYYDPYYYGPYARPYPYGPPGVGFSFEF